MNRLMIILVPVEATQPDLEAAWREHFAPVRIGETTPQVNAAGGEIADDGPLPLWTWFIRNPRR
jgi:hypothetical protein